MGEALVYEDTPFADYLSEIGSKEELTKQPEIYELEASQSEGNSQSRFSHLLHEVFDYLHETLSTALPLQEENEFEERFKYLLCTSHLLNDTLSIYFYDSRKPNPIDKKEAGLYFGGISRRSFEILLSSLIGLTVEAFISYSEAILLMQPEISKSNLTIMYNMYNITPCPEGDVWDVEDEKEKYTLENLKQCFQMMHAKRRECLCHFLALDVMTPGRDSHRRDYEYHWAAVNGHLDRAGIITGSYLDRINVASANTVQTPKQDILLQPTPTTITNKKLKAYLHRLASIEQHIRCVQAKLYICNEDARKYFENDAEGNREQLLSQYESITKDFTYMFQEWEDGKKALKDIIEPSSADSDMSSSLPSLDGDTETLNDSDENVSEKALTIDWSQIDEPLDVQEQVFVAEVEAEQITKAKARAAKADSERMVHELKDVLLVRRRPKSFEDEILQPSKNFERIQIQGAREVVTN
ncbi:1464_t:CDS:2 [Acaulospora colombiana]|uniref:1464_t:CDS:1 n=1 Tax=Acaulospora colombiana TaxID=27376 RepID=A0ACA9JXW6_9GLOM|nr:1464_t:CDS:2 [Acaulospora colombiana]